MYFSYEPFRLSVDKILTILQRALFIVNLGNILTLRVGQHFIYQLEDIKSILS
jgi:hypothetical protein